MPHSPIRRSAVMLGLVAAIGATPAIARHHGTTHAHKTATAKRTSHETHAAAAPHGAVAVPTGGLKVYCPQRSPLLVRKMTQGAGTTVTVLCR